MAKYDIKFIDINEGASIQTYTEYGYLKIIISAELYEKPIFIDLDISTAIKFAKTLRTEINKAKEVDNG